MTGDQRDILIQDVKRMIWEEIRDTIPPSYDPMRSLSFAYAAEKAVDLCLERVHVEVS